MAYRGDDLDLRTSHGFAASGREPADASAPGLGRLGGRAEPRWVDDLVLASFNDAFDLAVAHRAGEVTIEHLLNAMTRIEAAAKLLELAGIRVSALRRETGSIIASDLPVAFGGGKGTPRTSREIEDLVRLAAERSHARRAPVGIEDILGVLSVASRNAHDGSGLAVLRRHWGPRLIGQSYREGASLVSRGEAYAAEEPRERVRAQARSAYIAEAPRVDAQPALADGTHSGRVEALERLVGELAGERRRLDDIQGDLLASREDATRFHNGLMDRLAALEQALAGRSNDAATFPQVTARLETLERNLEARLADIERSWSAVGERLQGLEAEVQTRPDTGSGGLDGVIERLQALERSVQSGMGEGARNWAGLAERLKALDPAPIAERLEAVQARLAGEAANAVDLAPVLERLAGIENGIEGRIATAQGKLADSAGRIEGEVRALAALVTDRQAASERAEVTLAERIQSIGAAVERDVAERLSRLERAAAEIEARVAGSRAASEKEQAELRDALAKLAASHQALAASTDQWRLDQTGDFSVLGNRLKAIEASLETPLQLIGQMSADMQTMHAHTLRRETRRSRFRMWMFGTDDWFGESFGELGTGSGKPLTVGSAGKKAP